MLPEKYVFDTQEQILKRIREPDWTWEEACEMGLMARNLRDLSNWVIGTVALGIETKWGIDRLGEFAKMLGFERSTVEQYRWVVRSFPDGYLPQFGLPWSFYRLAAGTDKPKEVINQIIDQSLNYNDAKRFVSGVPIARECPHKFEELKVYKCKQCGVIKNQL